VSPSEDRKIIIAIDGPAGSGKSSTAREVATRLRYRHLDSGAFYRAVTLAALERDIPPERWDVFTDDELSSFRIDAVPSNGGYSVRIDGVDVGERIRAPSVNAAVSRMAAVPAVRRWLHQALRAAGQAGGLVADGRDIGTVVFPEAELKVFLVCDPMERARRRLLQTGQSLPTRDQVQAEALRLQERDALDETRSAAPLRRAYDAVLLDTTDLAFDEQVSAIIHLAESRIAG
jgi:cytidylate kinase